MVYFFAVLSIPTLLLRTLTDKLAVEGHSESLLSLQIPDIPSAQKLQEHLAHKAFDPINTQLDLKPASLEPSG